MPGMGMNRGTSPVREDEDKVGRGRGGGARGQKGKKERGCGVRAHRGRAPFARRIRGGPRDPNTGTSRYTPEFVVKTLTPRGAFSAQSKIAF
eukprot:gene11571-biopygen13270